ncbi:hypothetical protein [uncultured Sphingomonas sp.]
MTTGGALGTVIAFTVALLAWLLALYEHRKVQAYKVRRDAARLPAE